MKTNHRISDSDRTGENRIIRRDTECLLARGGVARMTEAELDRHLLVMVLGLARAQVDALTSDRDVWKAMYGARKAVTDRRDAR